jgi:hypothetical protein
MRPLLCISATILILVSVSPKIEAQQTTDTNCNVNGSTANCTSRTTDNAAQQQRAYEAGQQVGNALGAALGLGIRKGIQAHDAHKLRSDQKTYCEGHPGETGYIKGSFYCQTDGDKGVVAANIFVSKHRDYVPEPANSQAMMAYINTHNLDPREERTFERSYKDLKKAGQLHLYAR